jgi:predicted dehydrogenase
MMINSLAIIGLGSIGRRHLRLISEIKSDIEIIVVRSGCGSPCEEESLATKTVYSITDAIKYGIQAAVVSSPATLHIEQSLELAKSGVHLLIEKPLSHTLERVEELLEVVNDNDVIAMVGYVLRYDPGAIKFKNWLGKKITSDILYATIECGSYLPDWRPDQDYRETVSARNELGGGVLLELSHEIDYLHWFFGRPIDVQAQIRNSGTLDIDVEDQADLLLTSKQGYPITLHIDFNRRFVERKCKVLTTEGELTWDAVNKNVTWKTVHEDYLCYEYSNERDNIYNTQLENFMDCIENGTAPSITAEDGMNVISLIDAARSSSLKGCKVSL